MATYVYSPQFLDSLGNPLANVAVTLYPNGVAQIPANVVATGFTDQSGLMLPGATLTIGATYDFTTSSYLLPLGQFTAPSPRQLILIPGPIGLTGATGSTGNPGPIGPLGLVGPIGADGMQGTMGGVGATGAMGPTGATGPAGATGATGSTASVAAQAGIGLFLFAVKYGTQCTAPIPGAIVVTPSCLGQCVVPVTTFGSSPGSGDAQFHLQVTAGAGPQTVTLNAPLPSLSTFIANIYLDGTLVISSTTTIVHSVTIPDDGAKHQLVLQGTASIAGIQIMWANWLPATASGGIDSSKFSYAGI